MADGLSPELQEFLWEDRTEPYYAAHRTCVREPPLPKAAALRALAQGARFFSPTPRIALGGSTERCAPFFNAPWCDIDIDPALTLNRIVTEAADRLEAIDFYPSVVVYSGRRGLYLYWRLDDDLPAPEIEAYNRLLAGVLEGDHCFPVTQLMRHPGTIHEKSGRQKLWVQIVSRRVVIRQKREGHALTVLGHRLARQVRESTWCPLP